MAKNFHGLSLDEIQEELKAVLDLSKKFDGYKIRPNILGDIEEAASSIEEGHETLAIKYIDSAITGVRATLVGFFRNSPIYFSKLSNRAQLEFDFGFDEDIQARIAKALGEVSAYARLQVALDLNRAAEIYVKAHEILRNASIDQRARIANRRMREEEEAEAKKEAERKAKKAELEKKEAERAAKEAEQAAKQKLEEQKRRSERAKSLRDLTQLVA